MIKKVTAALALPYLNMYPSTVETTVWNPVRYETFYAKACQIIRAKCLLTNKYPVLIRPKLYSIMMWYVGT